MKLTRLVLGVVAVAATMLTFTTDSHAQAPFGRPGVGRTGAGLGRGIPLAGAERFQRGRVSRRGVDTLLFGDSGYHEFARTIPRVFGDPILPYYALYPPVYYSYPVPRPYGFSPFALPPGKLPAEGFAIPEVEPEVTINPYFKPSNPDSKEVEPTDEKTVAKPQIIENPYYVKRLGPEQSKKLAGSAAKPDAVTVDLR